MDNQRLMLLAILGFLGMLLWMEWQKDYNTPQPSTEPTVATMPGSQAEQVDTPAIPRAETPPQADVAAVADGADATTEPASLELIRVKTDLIEAAIDPRGAAITDLKLLSYPVSLETPDQPFHLLHHDGTHLLIAQTGIVASTGASVTNNAVYSAQARSYELGEGQDGLTVRLTHATDGLVLVKTFHFSRDSYQIKVTHEIRNTGEQPWTGSQYVQLQRNALLGDEQSMMMPTYTGGAMFSQEDGYEKMTMDDIAESPLANRLVKDGWIAFIQHYFVTAVIPKRGEDAFFYARELKNGRFVVGATTPPATVAPGAQGSFESTLMLAPKEQDRMAAAAAELDRAVDYGYLWVISKPLFWVLDKIHAVVGNWGWAIIVLTLLIKLAFFPLSDKAYRSMARMRAMNPRIQALRERFADDKQQLNQAMMDLYKKEKINPLGGCLPMLVQIPVFIALYYVLLESVEMRQAAWILWIDDLSLQDPYYVLPVIMAVSMFVQQKLNPPPPDPVQAKIMMALPLVFGVFFLFFPAGLVLYWVANNVLSIAQQWVITKRIESGQDK
ncbi:MAG: membrane protein insertase YidC [Gammaproteobacteria bacterium]